ncbi:hypothetical protein FHX44_113587 [Pseudonocardia hierapolitana]|uniref:Uncharacterized protein n=1 Tax=Pseudonocardia hierapolitana TaxID=1128676 RepID=A0A561SS53_9PSEU|nr:hypothetical protein [Pseudonocardia hierapolitana]TWF77673.1 hypothetical protein FHX44_113587 [Pseudonocardia hierapolitana]
MPIRTPHGRSAAYRAIWAWPLRSPLRLAVTTALVIAVAVGATFAIAALGPGRAASGPADASGGLTSDGRAPAAARTPTPTMLPPVPELTPSQLPLSAAPRAAVEVAARWAGAWVRPRAGTTAQEWLDGLRSTTTDEYLGVLSGVDPENIPATRVTGEPRPVRVAARSVQVEVPTDRLKLLVLVVRTEDGWRVAGYDRE